MILTLCGSARFEPYWHEANKQLGLAGHICFSLMTFPSVEGDKSWYTPEQKWSLDLAHLAKIEQSHGVVMLNIDRYLGESSLRELQWARIRHKRVYWTMRDERARINDPNKEYKEHFARGLMYPSSGEWIELINAVERSEK